MPKAQDYRGGYQDSLPLELSRIKLAPTLLPSPPWGTTGKAEAGNEAWDNGSFVTAAPDPTRAGTAQDLGLGLGGCCAHRQGGRECKKHESGRGSPTVCVDVAQLVV